MAHSLHNHGHVVNEFFGQIDQQESSPTDIINKSVIFPTTVFAHEPHAIIIDPVSVSPVEIQPIQPSIQVDPIVVPSTPEVYQWPIVTSSPKSISSKQKVAQAVTSAK